MRLARLWPALALALVAAPLALFFSELLARPLATLALAVEHPGEGGRLALVLARTLALAALAATVALAAALAVFVAIEPALARGRCWPALFMLPLLVPGHFVAIAWIQWLGYAGSLTAALGPAGDALPRLLYSLPGVALAMGLKAYPLALAFLWIGWRAAGSAPVEAAALLMPAGRLWRRFLLGWMRPWLAAGWLVVLVATLLDYSIPSLMRLHVFSVEIVSAFNVYYRPEQAMALSLPLLAASLTAAAALGWLLARTRWPVMGRRPCRLPRLAGRWRMAWGLTAAAVLGVAFVVPTLLLARMAGDLAAITETWGASAGQMRASLGWSALATLAALALAVALTGAGLWRARGRAAAPTAALMLLLYALPGSVLAIALIRFYNRPTLGALYDGGAMLPLGLAALHLPVAWLILRLRALETPAALVELDALAPAPPLRRWLWLAAPRLARPALVAAAVVFVLCMNETQASLLLAAPGQETLSVRAMTLLHYAPDRLVAAYCLTAWAVALAPLLALWLGARLARPILRRWMPDHDLD